MEGNNLGRGSCEEIVSTDMATSSSSGDDYHRVVRSNEGIRMEAVFGQVSSRRGTGSGGSEAGRKVAGSVGDSSEWSESTKKVRFKLRGKDGSRIVERHESGVESISSKATSHKVKFSGSEYLLQGIEESGSESIQGKEVSAASRPFIKPLPLDTLTDPSKDSPIGKIWSANM